MKNVILKSLTLNNFKGIKKYEVDFKPTLTNLYGANGTGKTSIFDSFVFLMFGKNSEDKKDFSIKNTKDTSLNKSDHEVIGVLLVDRVEIELKKVYKEKWTKKRGSEFETYEGNSTEYFWNGIPMQQKEFQLRVSEIMDENLFKILTNPLYFNQMKWQDQRNILLDMCPISDDVIADGDKAFQSMLNESKAYKSLAEWKSMLVASIKKSKEEVKQIPARIDEVKRGIPEDLDFDSISKDLEVKNNELASIENQIKNKSAAYDELLSKRNELALKISNLKNKITSIEVDAIAESNKPADNVELNFLTKSLGEKNQELTTSKNGLQTLTTKLEGKKQELISKEAEIVNLRKQWGYENAKELVFDDNSFHCPTCKREFESGDVEAKKAQMLTDFKIAKNQTLTSISASGAQLSKEKTDIETEIKDFEIRIETGKGIIADLENSIQDLTNKIDIVNSQEFEETNPEQLYASIIASNSEYAELKKELETLEASFVDVPKVDTEALDNSKRELVAQIDELKTQLALKSRIDSDNRRITELEEQQKTLNQEIAEVEKKQFIIDRFNKAKIDTLEAEINKKFKIVKFKMFDTQVNGGETECCVAMVDNVPFSDCNHASKFNAGIDIINTLSEFYGVTAPIFFDNAESVHTITETNSQLIRLVVSEEDKKLRVA